MPLKILDDAASEVVAYTPGSLTVKAGHGARFGNPTPDDPLLLQVGPDAEGRIAVGKLTCIGRTGDVLTTTFRSGAVPTGATVAAGVEKVHFEQPAFSIAGLIEEGDSIAIAGAGTKLDPYVISANMADWYFSDLAPVPEDGKDGDFVFERPTGILWRKEDGAWVNEANLTGPQGVKGDQGEQGEPGPQGEPGEGAGSVTEFTFLPANGFSGSVSTATTTPQLTMSTPVTGMLKGAGGALTAAVAGTDYVSPSGLTTALGAKQDTLGAGSVTTTMLGSNAVTYAKIQAAASAGLVGASAAGNYGHVTIGTGLSLAGGVLACTVAGTVTSVGLTVPSGLSVSGSPVTGAGAITVSTTLSGVLKGTGSGFIAATPGTDFQAPITLTTSGSSGPATLIGNTLNVPQYAGGVSYPLVDGASQSSGTADQWVFRDTLGVAASAVDKDGNEGAYELRLTLAVGVDLVAGTGLTGGIEATWAGKISTIRIRARTNGASGGFTVAVVRTRSGSPTTIATQAVAASNTSAVVVASGSISDLSIQAGDLFDVTVTSPGSGVQGVSVSIAQSRRNR